MKGRAYSGLAVLPISFIFAGCGVAMAQDAPKPDPPKATNTDPPATAQTSSPYMFGDWNGERSKLADSGVVFNFQSVNDTLMTPQGDFTKWSRVRGTLDIDFDRSEIVSGLKFHITGLWQGGGNMGGYIGSIANPSSLVSANTFRLDSFWFEKSFLGQRVFVRLGQFAGQDSYGVQEYGGSYLLEPMGYALGNLFGSTFETFDPASTPAAEIRLVPSQHFYVKSAIFSGNRNPYGDDPIGLHFKFKDTPVIASETGVLFGQEGDSTRRNYPGSYKFGAVINPGPFPNLVTGVHSTGNYLLYFMINQAVYRAGAGSDRGLDVTFAYDWSPDDVARINTQTTGGLRYRGLLPHREHDALTFGIVYSHVSDVLNRFIVNAGLPMFGSEKALEVNYSIQVKRWFTFQPVFQHYFDAGGNPQMRNSTVVGFRSSFNL